MEDKFLDLSDYVQKEEIGEGSFGKVYLVEKKKTGEIFAAKVLNLLSSNS